MNANIALLTLLTLFSCSKLRYGSGHKSLPGSLNEATNSSSRAPENTQRDEFQHPVETLEFFGIRPEMTVVEIAPGAGYYTEILAPYLAKQGQYVMAVPRVPSNAPAFLIENEKKLQDILLSHPDIQTKTKFVPFEPLDKRNKTKPEFADMVITFNSIHTWVGKDSVAASFKFCYDVLKPNGILGIVQHRIPLMKKNQPKSGYLTEQAVTIMAARAGFKLVQKSEVNANPKDTADYPKGVWTLPPVYRLGEVDRDKYEDIGESDRMTLKFVKVKRK